MNDLSSEPKSWVKMPPSRTSLRASVHIAATIVLHVIASWIVTESLLVMNYPWRVHFDANLNPRNLGSGWHVARLTV